MSGGAGSAAADWVVWETHWRPGQCRLGPLENVDRAAEIAHGRPRAGGFPAAARFVMNPNFPDDTELADRLVNHSGLLVVSARVVDFLRERETGPIEFLPVWIVDHRDRTVDEPFFVVNPLEPVPCLDIAACQPQWNKILPGKIRSVKKLVVDASRIDPRRLLFGCDQYHAPKIVHRSLARAMSDAGFTGCRFVELGEFRA